MFFELFVWGGLGLIMGSFTNVLILRHGVQSLTGRSECPKCHTRLAWLELVPVFSWVALRGRCRTCAKPISLQYPLVEILVALGFVCIGISPLPLFLKIIGCGIVLLCIALAVYDTYHLVLPDPWVWSFNALALFFAYASASPSALDSWYVILLSGPIVALPLFLMWRVSDGTWMGFGDVKYALGIGWLLGAPLGYVALMYAFVSGAFVGLLLIFLSSETGKRLRALFTPIARSASAQKEVTMKSEVPFGPFLIFGTMLLWVSALFSLLTVMPFADLALLSSW